MTAHVTRYALLGRSGTNAGYEALLKVLPVKRRANGRRVALAGRWTGTSEAFDLPARFAA